MATAEVDDDERGLICPACGFDLRGTQSDRCGECGLAIDRAALAVSGIPWAHRRRIGRVRAYFKTFWGVLVDRKGLRYEAAKPQEMADGRAFARVTGFWVAAALVGAFVIMVRTEKGLGELAVLPEPVGRFPQPAERWFIDGVAPWSAGATLWGVFAACLAALGFWLAGAARYVFRSGGMSAGRSRAAVALLGYATAPLALLAPAAACLVGLILVGRHQEATGDEQPQWLLALAIGFGLFALVALVATCRRVGQWLARTRHCGAGPAVLGVAEMVGLWLLGGIVLLGLVPWCVGFLWVVVDSVR